MLFQVVYIFKGLYTPLGIWMIQAGVVLLEIGVQNEFIASGFFCVSVVRTPKENVVYIADSQRKCGIKVDCSSVFT